MASIYQQRRLAAQNQKFANDQQIERERRQAALIAAEARAKLEQERIDAKILADKIHQQTITDRAIMGTNAAWNNLQFKQAAADKKPTIQITTTDKDGTKTVRHITPAQQAAEIRAKNAPEVAALQSELDDQAKEMAAGDKRYGLFNIFSRDKKVAELKKQMAELQPPGDMLAADPVAAAAAAMPAAPMTSKSPFDFNGTTSLSGHGFAPVQSRGFIGTPGGANAFRNNWDPVEAAAELAPPRGDVQLADAPQVEPVQSAPVEYPDPLADAEPSPIPQDLRQGRPAVVNLEDPAVGDPVPAKIVIQKGNRFKINPDGTTEHLGPVAR